MAKAAKKDTKNVDILEELGVDAGTEVEVGGDDEFVFGDLPTSSRAGGRSGSIYGFEKFPAPKSENGPYAQKLVAYGEDAAKTKRSVQSAVTQANRTNKPAKEFKTRDMPSSNGILIIRVK